MRSSWRIAPFLRREGAHGKRMDLFPHALAERRVYQLVALHAAAAGELRRDHQRLEVLAVADHLEVLAGEPRRDARLHAFHVDHSMPELVAGLQELQGQQRYDKKARRDDRQARERREVRSAEEAVAEAVDHVEERIGVRGGLPERWQRVDRVENAGEEGERQDEE